MTTATRGEVSNYTTAAEEYLTGDRNVFQDLLDDLPAHDKAIIDRVESIFGRIEDVPDADAHKPLNTFVKSLYTRAITCLKEIPKDEPKKGVLVHGAPKPPLQTMMGEIFVLVVRVVRTYQENKHNVYFFRRVFKIELDRLENELKKIRGNMPK